MKRTFKKLAIAIVIILSLFNVCKAEDNLSLTISCTIPIIPGVNAPLIEEGVSSKETNNTGSLQISQIQKEESRLAQIIQEDKKVVIQSANGKNSSKTVQTIYYR
jgi:hypothetical protein